MAYVIVAKDKPDSLALRQRLRPEHLEYLERHAARLLAGGALLEDDGSGGLGSVIIYDTDDRAEVDAFSAGDPFRREGLFAEVAIHRWRKLYLGGAKVA